jgi:hypothetical protein
VIIMERRQVLITGPKQFLLKEHIQANLKLSNKLSNKFSICFLIYT